MSESPPKQSRRDKGMPWWRFWPIVFIFIAGTWYVGVNHGKLQESSGTDKAVNAFLKEEKEIMQKWYGRTCNTVDDCREFLRKYSD